MAAKSISGIVNYILRGSYFNQPHKKDLIRCSYEPSEEKYSKFLIVTGDNAEGKSFFVKLFDEYCHKFARTECLLLGMSLRTDRSWARSFVYKDESNFSTGDSSINCVIKGLETGRKREQEHYLIFDEPNLGLAESYHYALGEYFAGFVKEMPPLTKGLVIVTHSRKLVRPLLEEHPHHLRFGDHQKLKDWIEREPKRRTLEELLQLPEKGLKRFRRINQIHQQLRKLK